MFKFKVVAEFERAKDFEIKSVEDLANEMELLFIGFLILLNKVGLDFFLSLVGVLFGEVEVEFKWESLIVDNAILLVVTDMIENND